jgi:hypothetical protein
VAAPSNDQLSGTDQRNFLLTSTVVASPFNDNVVSLIAVGSSNVRSYEILGLKPIIWLITYCKCLISLLLSWKIYQVRNLKDSSLNLYIIMFYAITESRSSRGKFYHIMLYQIRQ